MITGWCGQHERAVMDENGRPTIMPAVENAATLGKPTDLGISRPKLNPDGSLYFALDDVKRFMECVVEYDTETKEWVLMANDSVIAKF